MNTVLLTGTSSGIGLYTAVLLAKNKYTVYATMRDTSKRELLQREAEAEGVEVHIKHLDVQGEASIKKCVEEIVEKEGSLDILINNAGSGFLRTVEQASMKEISNVMDINFYGPIRCIRAVLPQMRKQKNGRIINISSVGGLVGQPINEIYCAAKFALEGFTESIAIYMQPYFGIKVSLIEPAGVVTEFGNNIMKHLESTGGIKKDAYTPLMDDYMEYRKTFSDPDLRAKVFQTPGQVADVILKCIRDENPALRYLTSEWTREFTSLKTAADPDGSKLQKEVRKRILKKPE
ncbi:MAG: SDR family oxidoreductase [Ginsengibacter sp.]